MPISAYYNGRYVVSTLMSDKEWNDMVKDMRKKRTKSELNMAWSGYPCKPKVSASGIRHFSHRPGFSMKSIKSPNGNIDYINAYTEILKVAHENYWTGKVEVPPVVKQGEDGVTIKSYRDWVAGIILQKGNQQIAFEITSGYSPESIKIRNEQYRKDGIRCMWLSLNGTHNMSSSEMPIVSFEINSGHNAKVHLHNSSMSLRSFIKACLNGYIKYVSQLNIWEHKCSCHNNISLWCKQYSIHPHEYPYLSVDNPVYSEKTEEMVNAYLFGTGRTVCKVATSDTGVKALFCPNCGNIYTETDIIEMKSNNNIRMVYGTKFGGRWSLLTKDEASDYRYATDNLDQRLIHLDDNKAT